MKAAGFSCAFVAYNCAHDVIFSDVYLRTNRTNHTKIMRCFPHCCPDHRNRSYCGSAIHLELVAPKGATPKFAPEDLVVYGRFRPHNAATFVPGQRIATSKILSSLLMDKPSRGEWVESKLVRHDGSRGNNSWLYEVNPSGRWYYPWSGAATIAMRATEHVFEALTFRRIGSDALEFLTGSKSPNFRLMSFRRGVAGNKPPKAGAEVSDESEEASPKKRTASSRAATVSAKKRSLPRSPVKQPMPASKPPQRIVHSTHHASMHLLRPEFSLPMPHPSEVPRGRHETHRVHEEMYSQPRYIERPRPREASFSTTLDKLLPWLQDLPASTIGSRVMLSWERIVQDACEAHVAAARNGTSGARLGFVPILAALEGASAASPSQGMNHVGPAPSPLDAIDAAVRVLLHLWFDVECVRASDASVARCLREACFPDRQRLAMAHAAWAQDMEALAKRFLHATTRVQWAHLSSIASGYQSHGRFSPPLPSPPPTHDVFSSRAFVARCRERFAHRELAHREAIRSHKRQRTRVHVAPSVKTPLGLLSSARVWRSRMEDVAIEIDGLTPNALSLLTVIQFWRHLSCIRLDYDHAARALSMASVFNASVADACFTRLVLDGEHRWFQCLPGGDATTGTTLMGFVVGDYVGYATSAGTLHVTTYLWPAGAGAATAYAWHWTLDAASLSTSHTAMSVVVERASIHRPERSFETLSITDKLRSVGRWQHVCQAQLAYQATHHATY